MVLFLILLFTIIILLAIVVITVSVGGSIFIVVFGDVIVCIFLIGLIIKHLRKRKKK